MSLSSLSYCRHPNHYQNSLKWLGQRKNHPIHQSLSLSLDVELVVVLLSSEESLSLLIKNACAVLITTSSDESSLSELVLFPSEESFESDPDSDEDPDNIIR